MHFSFNARFHSQALRQAHSHICTHHTHTHMANMTRHLSVVHMHSKILMYILVQLYKWLPFPFDPPCLTAVCASTMSVCVCVCVCVCDSWVPFCAISASFHAPFFSIFALECLRLVAMSWQGLSLPWLTACLPAVVVLSFSLFPSLSLLLPLSLSVAVALVVGIVFCQLAIALPISLLQIIYNFCACADIGPTWGSPSAQCLINITHTQCVHHTHMLPKQCIAFVISLV